MSSPIKSHGTPSPSGAHATIGIEGPGFGVFGTVQASDLAGPRWAPTLHRSMMRACQRSSCLLLAWAAFAVVTASASGADRFALRGEIVTPEGVLSDGAVVISGERIESVLRPPFPDGLRVVETGGIVLPGLIDLHNHLTWDVFPRWSAGTVFPNRYEWQQLPAYLSALAGPHATLISGGHGPAMARYAEVKAIAGGATSLAGLYANDLGPGFAPPYPGMMRMLDLGSRLYPDGTPEPVRYEVFPLVLPQSTVEEIRADLASGRLRSLLIHLAEGSPHDASSAMEYRILKARGLLMPGVTLIHGVALHREQFEEMHRAGVGLVWSPRSNFELYGATADVAAASEAGVTISIAPDWSPTGSDGMLEELAYAARWNAALPKPLFTDAQLVRMATSVPAALAGAGDKVGELRTGFMADVLVVRAARGDAYHALVRSGPADVRMVMVGGRPLYGQKALVESLAPALPWTPIAVSGTHEEVALPADATLGDWATLTQGLDRAMQKVGSHLGPLTSQ